MIKKQEKEDKGKDSYQEISSRARRVRLLLAKERKLIGTRQRITNFKEPVVMLMRRNRHIEFYEDATKGKFKITHSDGKPREVYLLPSFQLRFDYGGKTFNGYWCHEDFPIPLPEDVLISSEALADIVEKVAYDLKKIDKKEMNMGMRWVWNLS